MSEQLTKVIELLKATASEGEPTVEQGRARLEALAARAPLPADVRRQAVEVPGLCAEWVTAPGAARDRAVLYLHGGSYCYGSLSTHRERAKRVSRAAHAQVLLVEYRLAPENPFPAAVEDSVAAYRWLLAHGVQPSHLAVAGDSAGGGLAIAALVSLRDAGNPMPAAAVCVSPWTDLAGTGDSMTSRAAIDPRIKRYKLMKEAGWYLAGADPRTPLASPLYADLRGLPPLLIQVGTAEVLYDDSSRLAERARAAGVDVTLEVWESMIHGWQAFAYMLPEGQEGINHLGDFVLQRTRGADA